VLGELAITLESLHIKLENLLYLIDTGGIRLPVLGEESDDSLDVDQESTSRLPPLGKVPKTGTGRQGQARQKKAAIQMVHLQIHLSKSLPIKAHTNKKAADEFHVSMQYRSDNYDNRKDI